MRTIESDLKKEIWRLKKMKKEAECRWQNAPEGHVQVMKNKGRIECYYRDGDSISVNANGKYVKKKDLPLAKAIVQRDYDKLFCKYVAANTVPR